MFSFLPALIIKLDKAFRHIGVLFSYSKQVLLWLLLLLPWIPLYWIIKAAIEPVYGGFMLASLGAIAWLIVVRYRFPNSWIFAGYLIQSTWGKILDKVN